MITVARTLVLLCAACTSLSAQTPIDTWTLHADPTGTEPYFGETVANGMIGSGYLGHAFWDTELWMFPVLAALQPKIAQSLLEYRYERLDAARRNALAHGYEGAMFPWESAASGDEETPICCLTGEFEHHITGDVGVAAWNYYQITQEVPSPDESHGAELHVGRTRLGPVNGRRGITRQRR